MTNFKPGHAKRGGAVIAMMNEKAKIVQKLEEATLENHGTTLDLLEVWLPTR